MIITNNRRFGVKSNGQIFYRVRYSTGYAKQAQVSIDFSVGATAEIDKWDKENQRPMRGTRHKHGDRLVAASAIQDKMDKMKMAVDTAFKAFEIEGFVPDAQTFRRVVNDELGRKNVAERVSTQPSLRSKAPSVMEMYDQYLQYCKDVLCLADGTYNGLLYKKKRLQRAFDNVPITDVTVDMFIDFQSKCTMSGLSNRTLKRAMVETRTFFRWCVQQGYRIDQRIFEYKPRIKIAENDVVFLTYAEVEKIRGLNLDNSMMILARDFFIFQCTTGLRYSDVCALKQESVVRGTLSHVMIKTLRKVHFKLNSISQEIISRYKGTTPDGYLFPRISSSDLNDCIKKMCEMAEINEPIVWVKYIGSKRIEVTKPKYKFVSSHTGRRTFVSVALELGAKRQEVVAITGHSTEEMMTRYEGVAGENRSAASTVWDHPNKRTDEKQELLKELMDSFTVDELKELIRRKQ